MGMTFFNEGLETVKQLSKVDLGLLTEAITIISFMVPYVVYAIFGREDNLAVFTQACISVLILVEILKFITHFTSEKRNNVKVFKYISYITMNFFWLMFMVYYGLNMPEKTICYNLIFITIVDFVSPIFFETNTESESFLKDKTLKKLGNVVTFGSFLLLFTEQSMPVRTIFMLVSSVFKGYSIYTKMQDENEKTEPNYNFLYAGLIQMILSIAFMGFSIFNDDSMELENFFKHKKPSLKTD